MNNNYNKNLLDNARTLRKNMTKEERKLWYTFLNQLPIKFYRQKIIGKYIVDFYCSDYKIIIELDGGQHYEEIGIKNDRERDEYLKSLGFIVLRYCNLDVNKNFDGICEDILNHLI